MKIMLKTMLLLSFVFLIQACSDKAADKTYSLKGGLKITLSQEDFGSLREIKVDSEENLLFYQNEDPSITEVQTYMYDNFENYPPISFSYAYTKMDTNFFENRPPFGLQDVLYDDIEDLAISGKSCRKSVFTERENQKKVVMLSCHDNRQSWEIIFQTFFAEQELTEDLSQEEKDAILKAAKEINDNLAAKINTALKTIEIK